jgi:hypothetical protein
MKHPSARALHAYWERLRGSRAAPERAEIEPAKIGRLLGDIFLLELGTSPRFALRLAGTRLCALMGQEMRARGLGELFAPEDRPALFGALDGAADDVLPLIAGMSGETADGRHIELEMIVLPLRHRGKTHARMLGSILPLDVPYWAGTVPLERLHLKTIRMQRSDADETGDFSGLRRPASARLRVLQGGLS